MATFYLLSLDESVRYVEKSGNEGKRHIDATLLIRQFASVTYLVGMEESAIVAFPLVPEVSTYRAMYHVVVQNSTHQHWLG